LLGSSPTKAERKASLWWLTAASWLALVTFALTHALLSTPLKRIGEELGVGYDRLGALATPRSFAVAIATLLTGYAADRFGKRGFLVGGMLLIALALLGAGMSSTYAALMGAMFALGIGLGSLEALLSPLVAELHPRAVAAHMNVLHGFFPLGLAGSSAVVGMALERGVRWQTPFALAALPAAALALMFLVGRFPERRPGKNGAPLPVRGILTSRGFWLLAAAMALTAGGEGAMIHWSPSFIETQYPTSAAVGKWGLTVFGLAMAGGRFGAGWVVRRVPLTAMMVTVAGASAAASLALAAVPNLTATLVALALVGFFSGTFWPSILARGSEAIASGSATLLAALAVAGIAGFGISPLAVGVVAQHAGLRAGMGLVPAGFLLSALALIASGRHEAGRLVTQVAPQAAEGKGA